MALGDRSADAKASRELTITTCWRPEADQVTLSVQDGGTGIAPHDPDKLFEPSYTKKPDGMGIGLLADQELPAVVPPSTGSTIP